MYSTVHYIINNNKKKMIINDDIHAKWWHTKLLSSILYWKQIRLEQLNSYLKIFKKYPGTKHIPEISQCGEGEIFSPNSVYIILFLDINDLYYKSPSFIILLPYNWRKNTGYVIFRMISLILYGKNKLMKSKNLEWSLL